MSTLWLYELRLKTSGAVQPGVPTWPVIEAMSCWKKRERPKSAILATPARFFRQLRSFSLVAALMSTADSGLMAIAAMVVNDLVAKRRPAQRPLTATQALWLARGVTVGACALLVLISTLDVTLVGLAALQQQLLCQALPTVWLGLHWNAARAPALLCGMLVGLGSLLLLLLLSSLCLHLFLPFFSL